MTLRARWLGTVPYAEALALQRGLVEQASDDYLLLLQHPHIYTLGRRGDPANVLVDPRSVGAELQRVDRGGDVTYHGPGQLVGYPILHLADHEAGEMADTGAFVAGLETLLISVLADVGLPGARRIAGCPGVWVEGADGPPRKIAAVGVRISRGRSMHGFALNVSPDLEMFGHIVPCGITDKGVTSLAAEGLDVPLRTVVETVVAHAARRWGGGSVDFASVVWRSPRDDADLAPFSRGEGPGEAIRFSSKAPGPGAGVPGAGSGHPRSAAPTGASVRLVGRLAEAGVVGGHEIVERKPDWMRATVNLDSDVLRLRRSLRDAQLVTVCEEAGCPNLTECWSSGTATFMLCGERCTRACGFCLVDTRRPEQLDPGEPARVAAAAAAAGLRFVVLTMVARDDLADGGASQVAATVAALREQIPGVGVETLVSDFRGVPDALDTVIAARPDVFNHNIETVARLQRAVRPSAGYARSLSVLARARLAGLVTKSGIVVGMGEESDEIEQTLADLAAVGVQIVTIGQYLRPTSNHLPVARWWAPDDFARWKRIGEERFGLSHVEASPLTRSSYHAAEAVAAAQVSS